jgi:hypothetical protein
MWSPIKVTKDALLTYRRESSEMGLFQKFAGGFLGREDFQTHCGKTHTGVLYTTGRGTFSRSTQP